MVNLLIVIFFSTFVFLIATYYFSEKNVIFVNKSRSSYLAKLIDKGINLPLLKNDTNNIIIYMNNLKNYKKKRIWEKLISNDDK